jgi:hypothetical protein
MIKPRGLSAEEIASRAYELYVQRGGEHGKDVEDWLRAERELRDQAIGEAARPRAAQAGRQALN